jgi:phosphoserine phosphatase
MEHRITDGACMRTECGPVRVVCFDLDGTLVHGTSTSQHLSDRLGHGSLIRELEKQYDRGSLSAQAFAEAEARFYSGLSLADVSELLIDVPLIGGLSETIEALREQGIAVILGTLAWSFAAQIIGDRFGLAAASGVVMGLDADGKLSGRVDSHFDELDKVAFVRTYSDLRGVPMSQVVAVGDARSDVPLFGAVGYSVALNATPSARAAASTSLDTQWLPDILGALRTLDV